MNNKPAKPSTPKAVEDCRELLLWMIPHLDKFPRNRRYTLGEKLENRVQSAECRVQNTSYSHKLDAV